MAKEVYFDKDSLAKMVKGLDKAADAVGGTLGPKGRNVFVDDPMTPKITNDGATIAQQITFKDKLENAGAYVIKNTSSQTNDDAGDGTTTTAVLVQAIIHECLARPENPMEIKDSLKKAGDVVLKTLAKRSMDVKKEDIEKVALISAENKDLAKLIAEIISKLGVKAVINVEDSKTFGTEYEIVDGYEVPVGFVSNHFINDKKTGRAVYENIPVMVCEKKISNIADINPIFEQFQQEGINSCVIVCNDIEDSMLGLLVVNKAMGKFNSLVIRATAEDLRDIGGATGAKIVSDSTGVTFKNLKVTHLGKAKKVISDANKTLFLCDGASAKEYANTLEKTLQNEPNMYLQKKLTERIARLRGGIAVLKIGAPTDLEREYLKFKAEDAVKATQAAIEEGVVEGGGMALWRIAQEMKPKTIGEEILKKSLIAPLKRIVENSGKDYAEIVYNMPDGMGYDAKNDKYVPMIQNGIIDPAKVERCALENAVSSASIFITYSCEIVDTE